MPNLAWADAWFQRAFPALLGVLAVTLAAWAIIVATGVGSPQTPRAQAAGTTPSAAGGQGALQHPVQRAIRDAAGTVGPVRLGMGIEAAHQRLGERLVPVQQEGPGARRFELLAPRAGLKLSGQRGRIDTITVTNVGLGPSYVTGRGVSIGDPERLVRRRYVYAHLVCEREWWVQRGANTLRFPASRVVSSITLTSLKAPPLIECA